MRRREQRGAARRRAEGQGSYTFTAGSGAQMGDCRVLDVSDSGAGLELYGPAPRPGFDKEIFVRLARPEFGTDDLTLHGWVRNVAHTKFGFVRVGIEFVVISPEQHAFVRSLAADTVAATR
jgi:PilZ domain